MCQTLFSLKGSCPLFCEPTKLFVLLSFERFSNKVPDLKGEGYMFFPGELPDLLLQRLFQNNVDTWIPGWPICIS